MKTLDNELDAKLTDLTDRGNGLYELEKYTEAIAVFKEGLELLPQPQKDWEAAFWLNTSIGDCYFLLADYENAKEYLYDALNSIGALDNPFVHLRLGQALFELQEKEKAEEYLLRAYMLEGEDMFEDEDEKYIQSIEHLIK